ncbi:MAG TPA: vitamin K epoxide reductase family protein [Gemmatimonadales bacterium]|nr:vitamin K epoxide reductase family protein [Gemmatimonadales bacterium]
MIRRQAIALLALVGLLIATYLWLYKIGVLGELQCGTGSCEYVQTSPYAEIFRVPVAFIGVVGYVLLFVIGLAGVQPRFAADRRLTVVLAVLATIGFAFTLYLTAIEVFVLHAICRWCVGSAVIMTAIWGLALAGLVHAPSPATPTRQVSGR